MAGRPESPLDPGQGPVQRLAFELRKLRGEAGGPTYREMARRTGLGTTTLSYAAAGDRLPTLPVLLAYVRACDGEPQEWERRWRQAVRDIADEPAADEAAEPPYRGLGRFEPGDRELFFGRDDEVAGLAARVATHRLVAVVGASGSGKSSMLRAGLIPALQRMEEPRPGVIRILTPGSRPFSAHSAAITPSLRDGDAVVVIDQFEELFTLCTDPTERTAFVDLLLTAVEQKNRLRVVLAVRADFFGRCAEHPELTEALRDTTVLLGSMGPAALREAIVKPAAATGLIVERALTARIINEVAEEPGSLPLMSHALLETWRRRHGRALTEAMYDAAGGIHGAVARTAEQVYTHLAPSEAQVARRILLRLVTPGAGAQDTRRPTPRTELEADAPETSHVLEVLVRARLLTLDGDSADLAHEALITAWPRYRGWVDESRDRLRVQRELTRDAQTWHELGRDSAAVYRGIRLTTAQEAFAGHTHDLSVLERAFLDAGNTAAAREKHAAARVTRRLRGSVASLSVLLVLALVAGVVAWRENLGIERQRTLDTAEHVVALAASLRDSDPMKSMQLSLAAYRLADTAQTRSALLNALDQQDLVSLDVPVQVPGPRLFLIDQGQGLLDATTTSVRKWLVRGYLKPAATVPGMQTGSHGLGTASTSIVAVDETGDRLVSQRPDGSLQVWDTADARPVGRPFDNASGPPVFTPDGRTVAVISHDTASGVTAQVRDPRRSHPLFSHPAHATRDENIALSAGAHYVAWCEDNRRLQLWNLTTDHHVLLRGDGPDCQGGDAPEDAGAGPRFSPDGTSVAVISDGGVIRRWDTSSGQELPSLLSVSVSDGGGAAPDLRSFVFNNDGTYLAGVSEDGIRLWRIDHPDQPVWFHPLDGAVVGQPTLDTGDGYLRYLTPDTSDETSPTAGQDTWSVRTVGLGRATTTAWQADADTAVALSANGRASATLPPGTHTAGIRISNSGSGSVTRESVSGLPAATLPAEATGGPLMSFSADGGLLAYAFAPAGRRSGDEVRVWNTSTRRVTAIVRPSCDRVSGVALSPDARRLAVLTPCRADAVEVRDLSDLSVVQTVKGAYQPPVVFGPDDRSLVTSMSPDRRSGASRFGLVDLTAKDPAGQALDTGGDWSVAFSPDGRYLAVGDSSGVVDLWDSRADRLLSFLPDFLHDASVDNERVTLAFSHDGDTLAAGGQLGTLRLWDTKTYQPIGGTFSTPGDPIAALAFSSDDRIVYAQGTHTPLQAYPISPNGIAAQVCQRLDNAGLSPFNWSQYIPGIPYRPTCPPQPQANTADS